MKIKALKGKVLVTDLERGSRVVNGIIIPSDDGKSEGIRPRWCKVYSVGEDITDITPGQWILVEHLRWTRMIKIRQEDGTYLQLFGVEWPQACMLVSDDDPETAIFSVFSQANERAPV